MKKTKTPKAFNIYFDTYDHIQMLTMEQRGELFTALYEYAISEKSTEFDNGMVKMAFSFMRAQIARDFEKYREKCETNRACILKRYEKEDDSTNVYERSQKEKETDKTTNVYERYQEEKEEDKEKEEEYKEEKDKEEEKEKDKKEENKKEKEDLNSSLSDSRSNYFSYNRSSNRSSPQRKRRDISYDINELMEIEDLSFVDDY